MKNKKELTKKQRILRISGLTLFVLFFVCFFYLSAPTIFGYEPHRSVPEKCEFEGGIGCTGWALFATPQIIESPFQYSLRLENVGPDSYQLTGIRFKERDSLQWCAVNDFQPTILLSKEEINFAGPVEVVLEGMFEPDCHIANFSNRKKRFDMELNYTILGVDDVQTFKGIITTTVRP